MPRRGIDVDLHSRIPQIMVELQPIVDAAAKVGAGLVENSAKARVPVRSGRLRDAIHVEDEGEGDWAVVAGDNTAFYGHIVEFGGAFTPPHPFLIPALEANRIEVAKIISEAIRRLV